MNGHLTRDQVFELLEREGIHYQRFDHEAVYTVEEAHRALPDAPGRSTKNLFLRDEKGKRHFLLVVSDEKQVDLKRLAKNLELKPLSLASPERLMTYLGLEPGSVTALAVLNDGERQVELLVDEDLAGSDGVQCHPLVNTTTLVVSWDDLLRIFERSGHEPRFVTVPVR